jgi:hypothetical protein
MSIVPLLQFGLIWLALYALCFKLAALVFVRTELSWRNSFLFAFLQREV